MLKKLIFGFSIAIILLACVVVETAEKSIIEVVQYEWWSLKQANLFISEDACFYIDPNNLLLYIHYVDSGDYWTYNLEYDVSKDVFSVADTSFSFWFLGEEEAPEVIVKMGGLQKKSEMSLCYPYDSVAVRISKKLSQIVKFVSW
jgi:hypothetical protein